MDEIGHHYCISSATLPGIKRIYTVCKSLEPKNREEILAFAQALQHDDERLFDEFLFADESCDFVHMTIKNYKMPNGMSNHVFEVAAKSKECRHVEHDPIALIHNESIRSFASGKKKMHVKKTNLRPKL